MLRVNRRLLDLLRAHRIEHRWRGGERWREGDGVHMAADCELEPYSHIMAGHVLPARMGAFSYTGSQLLPNTRIGRYCSIGGGVEFIQTFHPTDWVTTSTVSYSFGGHQGFQDYLADRGVTSHTLHSFADRTGPVSLGNDVWVGQGAMFAKGVSVGDGAVIAARAVVTRDVEPYAIVAGTPAKVVRKRFDDQTIERLLATAWWRFGPDQIQSLDVRDVPGFIGRFEAALGGVTPPALPLPTLTAAEISAAVRAP